MQTYTVGVAYTVVPAPESDYWSCVACIEAVWHTYASDVVQQPSCGTYLRHHRVTFQASIRADDEDAAERYLCAETVTAARVVETVFGHVVKLDSRTVTVARWVDV